MAAGVGHGARLALDSYVMNGSVATLVKHIEVTRDVQGWQGQPGQQGQPDGKDATFYSENTLGDAQGLPALRKDTTASLAAVRKGRKWPRRAFLLLSAAALGVGTASAGYTGYRFLQQSHFSPSTTKPIVSHTTTRPTPPPTKSAVPRMAKAQFVFALHQQPVHAVSWSQDGTMLASGSTDAQLMLWNPNGTVHVRMQQAGSIRAIAWAAGMQQIAIGAGNQVTFVNPQSGTVLAQGNGHTNAVTGLAWSAQQPNCWFQALWIQKLLSGTRRPIRRRRYLRATPVQSNRFPGPLMGRRSVPARMAAWCASGMR